MRVLSLPIGARMSGAEAAWAVERLRYRCKSEHCQREHMGALTFYFEDDGCGAVTIETDSGTTGMHFDAEAFRSLFTDLDEMQHHHEAVLRKHNGEEDDPWHVHLST